MQIDSVRGDSIGKCIVYDEEGAATPFAATTTPPA